MIVSSFLSGHHNMSFKLDLGRVETMAVPEYYAKKAHPVTVCHIPIGHDFTVLPLFRSFNCSPTVATNPIFSLTR